MVRYVPRLLQPERPGKSAVEVRDPGGSRYDLTDPHLAGQLGAGVRLMRLDRGTFDAMTVSVITTCTVSALCGLAGVAENELRFRPNIGITPVSGASFAEDQWAGAVLRIGGAAIRVDRRDIRCVVVNISPGTGHRDASLMKVVGRYRRARAGVYGSTVMPGVIRVGDRLTVGP